MYLLSMTNNDYMVMTMLFGILAVISYWYRRKNSTSKDFLVLNSHSINPFFNILSMSSVGLPEFMLFSSVAACYGLPVVCSFIPLYLLFSLVFDYRVNSSTLINDLIQAKATTISQRAFYVVYGIFLVLIAATSISITVGFLKSLLGWEFGNTTLSLMAVVGVCLLLGGVISVVYNQVLVTILIVGILSVITYLSYNYIGVGNLINNLHSVASANNLSATYFTKPEYNLNSLHTVIALALIIMTLLAIYPLSAIKSHKMMGNKCVKGFISRLLQLAILVLIMFVGVFALATPNSVTNVSGSKVVTQQTRLSDGSLGFVVKSVPDNTPSMQRGIIPQNMNITDNFTGKFSNQEVSAEGFDFISAALVLIKHALPFACVSLVIIILLFYKTVSESLSFITLLTINGFYAPYYNQTKEEYENLWATRVFLFMYVFVVISLGLVFYKFFDPYYLLVVSVLFGVVVSTQLVGFRLNLWFNLVMILLMLSGLLFVNVDGMISLVPLIKFPSQEVFMICWGFLLFIGTIIFSVIGKLFKK